MRTVDRDLAIEADAFALLYDCAGRAEAMADIMGAFAESRREALPQTLMALEASANEMGEDVRAAVGFIEQARRTERPAETTPPSRPTVDYEDLCTQAHALLTVAAHELGNMSGRDEEGDYALYGVLLAVQQAMELTVTTA